MDVLSILNRYETVVIYESVSTNYKLAIHMIKIHRSQILKCDHEKGELYYVLKSGSRLKMKDVEITNEELNCCNLCKLKLYDRNDALHNARKGHCIQCEAEKQFPMYEEDTERWYHMLKWLQTKSLIIYFKIHNSGGRLQNESRRRRHMV